MKNILELSMNEMAGISFDCACGRHHTLAIRHIAIGSGTLPALVDMAAPFRGKRVFLLADDNTFAAAGQQAEELLRQGGHTVKSYVFPTGKDILIPDERALGRLFMELEPDTALIVAVGSGTLNDLGKYMSAKTGIPYIIVCTAPSMDGYASDGAPLICGGYKISFQGTLAYGIVGDTDIMKEAPMRLIHAGFGDVLGKLTALADWYLARDKVGEYYCETCDQLVKKAIQRVTDNAAAIGRREEQAIRYLIEALTLTGVAMGLIGVSRPASGAEHMLSHYWEMDAIAKGELPELHGIKVGLATPIVAQVFALMKDQVSPAALAACPTCQEAENLLRAAGAPVLPTDIGIDRELFRQSMLGAYKVRNRYSIFQLALDQGRLEECADIITRRIYG